MYVELVYLIKHVT